MNGDLHKVMVVGKGSKIAPDHGEALIGDAVDPLKEQQALVEANELRKRIDYALSQIVHMPSVLRDHPEYLDNEVARAKIFAEYDRAASDIDDLFAEMNRRFLGWDALIGNDRKSEFDAIQNVFYHQQAQYLLYGPGAMEEMRRYRQSGQWGEPAPAAPPYYGEDLPAPPEEVPPPANSP